MKKISGITYAFGALVFFTLMQILIKSLQHVPSIQIVYIRSIVSLVLTSFLIHKQKVSFFGKKKKELILRGVVGSIALFCYFSSLKILPLGNAVLIHNLTPLFTVVFALFLNNEKIRIKTFIGLAIALTGIIVLRQVDLRIQGLGLLFALTGSIGAAFAYNMIRKIKTEESSLTIVVYLPLISTIIFTPWAVATWKTPTNIQWPILILIGICAQLAQLCLTKAYQLQQAQKVAVVTYLSIPMSLIAGYFLFLEVVGFKQLLATAIIITGVCIAMIQKKNKNS